MSSLKDYNIRFSGLKLGEHSFDYELDNEFFELFEYRDFESANVKAHIDFTKKENSLELDISIRGSVNVPCDITNDPFDLPVENDLELVVKFGEEYDDSEEDILVLPSGEIEMNLAQYLYELTVLAVPLKRICPEVQRGEKGQEVLARLEDLHPENRKQEEKDEENETDPRWDKLKDLLN